MISKDRFYRPFEIRTAGEGGTVEGYAAKFEETTVLWEYDGIEYKEVISRGAFDNAKMVDVVMNYNHSGKPVARTKNKTLELTIDTIGLKINADLGGTDEARKMQEEIKGGYIDKMSLAFKIAPDGDEYDKITHTRRINKIERVYDVAAVDQPAYECTEIYARSLFSAEAEKEKMAAEAVERRKKILEIEIQTITEE